MPTCRAASLSALLLWMAASGAWARQSDEEKRIKDRQEALLAALKASKTADELTTVADGYLALTEEAVAANLYESALKFLDQAQKIAAGAKQGELATRATARAAEVKNLQKEHAKAKSAFKTVLEKPDDAEANLIVGKFLCFQKREWDLGLPSLAKCSDKLLKAAAEKDLGAGADAKAQIEAGNGWWTLGDKKGPDQSHFRARAAVWYERAWPSLDKVERIVVRERVHEALRRGTKDSGSEAVAAWQGADPKMLHVSDMYARSGQRSMFMQRPAEARNELVLTQAVSVVPGETYTASCWVLTDGEVKGVLRLLSDKFVEFPNDRPFWTRVTFQFVAPPATTSLNAQFILYSSGKDNAGRVWIDDVQISKAGTTRNIAANSSFEDK